MGVRKTEIDRWKGKRSADFAALNPGLDAGMPFAGAPSAAAKAKTGAIPQKSPLAVKFEEAWVRLGGPALTPEHRFHKERRWRFDYALPSAKIAIELEGGIHKRRGHASPKGYIKDCRKYNAAVADGWALFRLAAGMMSDEDIGFVCTTIRRKLIEAGL